MKLAVSTLFAVLVVGVSSTVAPNRLNRLDTVPIHTDAKWKEGTVTIIGGDPVDLSTLDEKTTPFATEGVEGDFKHVTDLHVDIDGSESPFGFQIRRKEGERPDGYQHCSFWIKASEDPHVTADEMVPPDFDILLYSASGKDLAKVVGDAVFAQAEVECEWR